MWVLYSPGPDLEGVRCWLRPDSRYPFGRTPFSEEGSEGVPNRIQVPKAKTVSRCHIVINVSTVVAGDGARLGRRPKIVLQEPGTKHGTSIDGVKMEKGSSVELTKTKNILKFGKHEHEFIIEWIPAVFSISFTTKEAKDPLALVPFRNKVENLGIKTIPQFVGKATNSECTTHVICQKRNTSTNLQALVNGLWIVTSNYLDAIVEAAKSPPGDDLQSRLEANLDENWPDPENFLPPKGNEPTEMPDEAYKPNANRKDLFAGWTIIICDKLQHNILMPVVMEAGGKVERFNFEVLNTLAQNLVDFANRFNKGTQNVAIVKPNGKAVGKEEEWSADFFAQVEELFGYKLVNQSSFLDIILKLDVTALRLPYDQYTAPDSTMPSSSQMLSESALRMIQGASQPSSSAPRRPMARTKPVETFDPFAFDSQDVIPATTSLSTIAEEGEVSSTPETFFPARSRLVTNDGPSTTASSEFRSTTIELEDRTAPQLPPTSSTRGAKRRAETQPEDSDEEDMFPGHRAAKKQRLAEEEARILRGDPDPEDAVGGNELPAETSTTSKDDGQGKGKGKGKAVKRVTGKKEKLETKFMAMARELREKRAKEAAEAQAQEREAAMNDNIEGMKNCGIVELMQINERTDKPVRDGIGDESSRWNDQWNGRKNFKKFRRNGRAATTRTAGGRVMVNMVEHKGRDYGIGDGYWLDNGEGSGTQQAGSPKSPDDALSFKGPRSRKGKGKATQQPSIDSTTTSQTTATLRNPSQSTAAGTKRSAPSQASSSTAKRPRTQRLQLRKEDESDDSEEDDGLKFKLRRRRKG